MLQHVAFAVNDPEEIKSFYEEVLLFVIKRIFSIDGKVSQKVFNVPGKTEVYVMSNYDAQFEIFITPKEERKVFSHVCLAYLDAEIVFNKATIMGYKAIIRNGADHNTYFIWDKSGNMFEIK